MPPSTASSPEAEETVPSEAPETVATATRHRSNLGGARFVQRCERLDSVAGRDLRFGVVLDPVSSAGVLHICLLDWREA